MGAVPATAHTLRRTMTASAARNEQQRLPTWASSRQLALRSRRPWRPQRKTRFEPCVSQTVALRSDRSLGRKTCTTAGPPRLPCAGSAFCRRVGPPGVPQRRLASSPKRSSFAVPPPIIAGVRLGRMVGLQKPDGGVRGLVMGSWRGHSRNGMQAPCLPSPRSSPLPRPCLTVQPQWPLGPGAGIQMASFAACEELASEKQLLKSRGLQRRGRREPGDGQRRKTKNRMGRFA